MSAKSTMKSPVGRDFGACFLSLRRVQSSPDHRIATDPDQTWSIPMNSGGHSSRQAFLLQGYLSKRRDKAGA
jgi:hypothetical protein